MACYRSVNHIELYSLALKSLYEFYNTVIKIRDLKHVLLIKTEQYNINTQIDNSL